METLKHFGKTRGVPSPSARGPRPSIWAPLASDTRVYKKFTPGNKSFTIVTLTFYEQAREEFRLKTCIVHIFFGDTLAKLFYGKLLDCLIENKKVYVSSCIFWSRCFSELILFVYLSNLHCRCDPDIFYLFNLDPRLMDYVICG